MSRPLTRSVTAIHEAAHAVIGYRLIGVTGLVCLTLDSDDRLGFSSVGYRALRRDDRTARALLVLTYAGGVAQRRVDPEGGDEGCEADEEEAAEILKQRGWQHEEAKFRRKAELLVACHWVEIHEVAAALQRENSLIGADVQRIADGARRRV